MSSESNTHNASESKETVVEKYERLFESPIVLKDLSDLELCFIAQKILEKRVTGALKKGVASSEVKESKVKSDSSKRTAWTSFRALVSAKLTELHLAQASTWLVSFSGYLWTDKNFKADPEKLNDDEKMKHLYHRFVVEKNNPVPVKGDKKKVVAPDSENEADSHSVLIARGASESAPTTGGKKTKKVVAPDSEGEEEEVKPAPKKVAVPAVPKKVKKDDTMKTPPAEGGLVQTFKGKDYFTGLSGGEIHVWEPNADGEAGTYIGIYNPKTNAIEEAEESDEE